MGEDDVALPRNSRLFREKKTEASGITSKGIECHLSNLRCRKGKFIVEIEVENCSGSSTQVLLPFSPELPQEIQSPPLLSIQIPLPTVQATQKHSLLVLANFFSCAKNPRHSCSVRRGTDRFSSSKTPPQYSMSNSDVAGTRQYMHCVIFVWSIIHTCHRESHTV